MFKWMEQDLFDNDSHISSQLALYARQQIYLPQSVDVISTSSVNFCLNLELEWSEMETASLTVSSN
ncbi:unnamed protein product [Heterobilharzia americana]|nr:unnamed protein product [Heterobilharzia americana]